MVVNVNLVIIVLLVLVIPSLVIQDTFAIHLVYLLLRVPVVKDTTVQVLPHPVNQWMV